MTYDETDLVERLHAVASGFEMPPAPLADDVRRGRRRVRRNRTVVMGAAAAAMALILGVTVAVAGRDPVRSDDPEPVERPDVVVGAGPVWYDATGLHHDDVVVQTPEKIAGALALVRSGAVYVDLAGEVWFHPWVGEPRVIGHDSEAGPGGDPSGDTAVWFEGSDALNAGRGNLVVYDTVAGREISRTQEANGVIGGQGGIGGDHYPAGNGFLQVSAERIVWTSGRKTYAHDVRTQRTSEFAVPKNRYVIDVHDEIVVLGGGSSPVAVRVPGEAEAQYPRLESHVRLSPSGNYLLGVEGTETRHAAAIVDLRTGVLWPVPDNTYPWIAWSYADVALLDLEDTVLACDATLRTCDPLQPDYLPPTMPTN
jgi:hypothetical protein